MNMFSATLRPGGDVELLRDKHDTSRFGIADASELARRPVNRELPLVGARRIDAGNDFHQRRFAGAVFPDDSDRFSRPDLQIDIRDRLNAREGFADPAQGQRRADLLRPGSSG
jgi:hypothetical protein